MAIAVGYTHRDIVARSPVGSGSAGGGVDEILRRLGNVEESVWDVKAKISAITATIQHLATAASVSSLRAELTGRVRTD
jgi:hypothetical protein